MSEEVDTAVSLEGVSIGYESRNEANTVIGSGLSLSLKFGELVCLLGPNGAGKSTLIRTLAGLDPALSGKIKIDGSDLETLSPNERARKLSVVLTDAVPAGLFTVYGIVSLGRHPHTRWTGELGEEDRARINWAMESVGVDSLAQRPFDELSDGERQKVMIARALAQEASILVLDEPTAFVDLPRRVELMRILQELAHKENMAILLSSHDLEISLRSADRLWLMNDRGAIAAGLPEDLAIRGAFAEVFESDGIGWDSEQGGFQLKRDPDRFARIEGEGDVALWTRKALLRKGYGLDADAEWALEVIISNINGHPIWRASARGPWKTFDSLETLFQWVEAQEQAGRSP